MKLSMSQIHVKDPRKDLEVLTFPRANLYASRVYTRDEALFVFSCHTRVKLSSARYFAAISRVRSNAAAVSLWQSVVLRRKIVSAAKVARGT